MLEYKKMIKRCSIYLAIAFPIILFMTYIFSLYDFPIWLNVLSNVVIGIILCLIFIPISSMIDKKRARNELMNGKPKDPFVD